MGRCLFTRTGAVFSLPPAARGCSAEEGAVSSWHSPPAPFWGPHTPQKGARELLLPPRWCPQHPAAPSHEGKPPAPPQEMLGVAVPALPMAWKHETQLAPSPRGVQDGLFGDILFFIQQPDSPRAPRLLLLRCLLPDRAAPRAPNQPRARLSPS